MDFKQYRTEKKLTQTEAGALIGMSGSFWGQLEKGTVEPEQAQAFARVLKYQGNPALHYRLTKDRMESVRAYGLNFKEASHLIGAGDNTWSNIASGNFGTKTGQIKANWPLLVNALLIELAEKEEELKKQADLDLTPGGDIEIVQPTILTPAPEAPIVEPEISDRGLIPFAYGQSPVRCKMVNDSPFWMLTDVCRAIGYQWFDKAPALIRERDQKTFRVTDSLGREQEARFISEAGLYQFLTRARVPAAEPFQDWLFDDVLPQIRKTGQYQAPTIQPTADPLSHVALIGQALQTLAQQMQAQAAEVASIKEQVSKVNYLEVAKPDRSEVLEIVQTEVLESKVKEKQEQRLHYHQRKELEKRISDLAWATVKQHGGDHGEFIKSINKRIKAAIKGVYSYAIGRDRYTDEDFALAYQVVSMIEKELNDFPKQGEIDFGGAA